MKILITAFGPFDGFAKNPSELVLNELKAANLEELFNIEIRWETLPVSFSAIDSFLDALEENFDLIIHMGVASGETALRFEVIGQNSKSGTDITGRVYLGEQIIDESNQITTSFPTNVLTDLIDAYPGITKVSSDAGTYLCNYVYFKSLHKYRSNSSVIFIHIADIFNQINAPSINNQVKLVEDLISRFLKNIKPSP